MEIRSFDSLEEAQQAMSDGIAYGNARLSTAQRGLTYGSTFVEFDPDLLADRIVIFGRVLTLEEIETGARDAGATQAEVTAEVEATERGHGEGMLYSRAWSVVTEEQGPGDGELGSKHRFNIWPIPATLFESARQVGWDIDALEERNRVGMSLVYNAWRSHMLKITIADMEAGQ